MHASTSAELYIKDEYIMTESRSATAWIWKVWGFQVAHLENEVIELPNV